MARVLPVAIRIPALRSTWASPPRSEPCRIRQEYRHHVGSENRALSYRIAMVVLFVVEASPIFSVTATAFPLGALSGIRQLS